MASNAVAAAIEKDHLEPPISAFTYVPIVTDYRADIVKIFKKAYDPSVRIKAFVLPSFSQEYVIGIRERENKYYAFKLSVKEQYWTIYHEIYINKTKDITAKGKVELSECEATISKRAYEILNQAWHKMILKTQYYNDTHRRGLDGTSYYFISSPMLIGYTWSPEPITQTGYLVNLSELLGQLAESKGSKQIEKKIIETGTQLLKSLK
jgi:hypothetical protein